MKNHHVLLFESVMSVMVSSTGSAANVWNDCFIFWFAVTGEK